MMKMTEKWCMWPHFGLGVNVEKRGKNDVCDFLFALGVNVEKMRKNEVCDLLLVRSQCWKLWHAFWGSMWAACLGPGSMPCQCLLAWTRMRVPPKLWYAGQPCSAVDQVAEAAEGTEVSDVNSALACEQQPMDQPESEWWLGAHDLRTPTRGTTPRPKQKMGKGSASR